MDSRVAEHMGITDANTLQGWRVLGAALGMIPDLRSLFMLQGKLASPPTPGPTPALPPVCPEQDIVWNLIRLQNRREPIPDGFLQKIKTLVLEPHELLQHYEDSSITDTILMFLLNSSLLQRIEIKGYTYFANLASTLQDILPSVTSFLNVKELLLLRAITPFSQTTSLVALFPRLTSLQVEYADGSPDPFSSAPGIFPALLGLSKTLKTLSITTTRPAFQWASSRQVSPEGFDVTGWRDRNIPASLIGLAQMTALTHMTTESIWLFGRRDLTDAPQLHYILPPSLVHLRLIDYWGSLRRPSGIHDPFYPTFPNDWSPSEFYDQVFSRLYENHAHSLPRLRVVVFASQQLQIPALSGIDPIPEYTAEFRQLLLRFKELFARVGVKFLPSTLVAEEAVRGSNWACIS
ncbi:hypothetical protein GQ53DRAFT_837508 [Thozetella sp. PMI_491]|nr:hypothetical protein GQ53DRAFT_837508 [Thozetella sp. PMI_491]